MRRFCVAFVAAALCGGAFAQEPVAAPKVAPGDTWTYNRVDNWKREVSWQFEDRVAEATSAEIKVKRVRKDNNAASDIVYSAQWNLKSDGERTMSPEYNWLEFPLQPGKKYKVDFTWDHPKSGSRAKHEREALVEGWEEVTVPAGKFRALKVVMTGAYMRLDRQGSGRVKETLWYAPEVKRWVKSEYEDTDFSGRTSTRVGNELAAFKVQ